MDKMIQLNKHNKFVKLEKLWKEIKKMDKMTKLNKHNKLLSIIFCAKYFMTICVSFYSFIANIFLVLY